MEESATVGKRGQVNGHDFSIGIFGSQSVGGRLRVRRQTQLELYLVVEQRDEMRALLATRAGDDEDVRHGREWGETTILEVRPAGSDKK